MTSSQQWLDLAHSISNEADRLEKVSEDLTLQRVKLRNSIDALLSLEEQCKLEARKQEEDDFGKDFDKEEEQNEEQQPFPPDGCMDNE